MTEDIKKINPNAIHVKRESFFFLDGDKEVVLPRNGKYLPRNDGKIITYEEGNEGQESRYYSF